MKILYVDQTGKLGGGEIALLPLLQHRPQDARMILLEDGPFRALVEAAGIPVEVLALDSVKAVRRESGVGSVLAAIPAFFRLCRSMRVRTRQADVVYANSQKAFLLAAFSRQKGQPLVWHLRGHHYGGTLQPVDATRCRLLREPLCLGDPRQLGGDG